MFGIEGRYAHAAYSAAAKKKSVDKVETELTEIQVCGFVVSSRKQAFLLHWGGEIKGSGQTPGTATICKLCKFLVRNH